MKTLNITVCANQGESNNQASFERGCNTFGDKAFKNIRRLKKVINSSKIMCSLFLYIVTENNQISISLLNSAQIIEFD